MDSLNSVGIYPGVHYRDNTNYKMYDYAKGTCPNSYVMSERLISLPLHLNLSNEDLNYIVDNVKKINTQINK